jgi:hypothetical protein
MLFAFIEDTEFFLCGILPSVRHHVEFCIPCFYREDLENIVSLDTCILLVNQHDSSCYLKLKLGLIKVWQIKKVSIVSEVRILRFKCTLLS